MRRLSASSLRLTALAASCALLAACAQTSASRSAEQATNPAPARSAAAVQQQRVAPSLYEIVQAGDKLYVASAGEGRRDKKGGHLWVLDPQTLASKQSIETARKPFALALNKQTGILYIGNTYESYLTAVDAASGKVLGEVALHLNNAEGERIRTRQVAVDEATNTVYVAGIDDVGVVWIVDGKTLTLQKTLRVPGSTGLFVDAPRGKVYTSGTNSWSVIDAQAQTSTSHRIDDKEKRYLINLVTDPSGQRLLATDSTFGELLVFDIASAKLIHSVPIGKGALGIRYNAKRNEYYTSSREAGSVQIIDGNGYAIKRTVALNGLPSSLQISDDGNTLFVVLKQPFDKAHPGYREDGVESVVKIDLQ